MSMSYKENVALFGNAKRDNIIFTLDAGETMTCYFKADGTNTTATRYWNLTSFAKKVSITVNNIATMTHIGNQELESPRTLGTANVNTWKEGIEWEKITVRADTDNTTFEIYAS